MANLRIAGSWSIVIGCAVVSLFSVIYPMYVIRPFRAQGASELEVALLVMRIRPILTLLCVGIAVPAAALYWNRATQRSARIAAAGAVFLACLSAVVARVNVFEWMFHPVDTPAFESTAQVKLDTDEKVLAVQLNRVARAYPIRAIAYHHVVNDNVGGVPIVATY